MKSLLLMVLFAAVAVSADNRDDFLDKICNKCDGCVGINVIGSDSDGDPIFDCEQNCKKCDLPACQAVPRVKECKFCRKNEAVNKCSERCQRGCTFCSKTKACKDRETRK
uniref:Uncharacterized protein n=1 Tax=Acartia pacifica TaxID=335913 RepID=A0A0U2UFG7_ACAPC|nr:hypothetical protein [Acartia pacifica]